MADIADEAQTLNETALEISLRKISTATTPFSGFCLHCDEPVIERRFCDSDCRQDFERDQRRNR